MKAFIMAADALTPEYIFKHKELFPNICAMIERGASGTMAGYVQKGYGGSYTSEQNWPSIYTGLPPAEHKIDRVKVNGIIISPEMCRFNGLKPFWEVFNDSGMTVGLWAADSCDNPVEIYGYAVSSKYTPIQTPSENRESPRNIQVCKKDLDILDCLCGSPPPRLYPKTLKQQGFSFEQLKEQPGLVSQIANECCFREVLDNFKNELEFWFCSMVKAQREHPVDVMYLFTPSTDIIPHFTMYCDDNPIIIGAYQMLDRYIGEFIREFSPEVTIVMSDHGQQNFKELVKCSNPEIQREAFAARDQVVWLDNGYIAFEALNGGLLFTAHSLNGVFIACGEGIKNTHISGMRILDIYPTLLELFGIKVPAGRSGFIADIFDKPLINKGNLPECNIPCLSIALLQTHEMSIMDIVLNELYYEKRFAEITVVGEIKYEEIFRNNPRVSDFLPIEKFNASNYDEVYCGFFNRASNKMSHIKVT